MEEITLKDGTTLKVYTREDFLNASETPQWCDYHRSALFVGGLLFSTQGKTTPYTNKGNHTDSLSFMIISASKASHILPKISNPAACLPFSILLI